MIMNIFLKTKLSDALQDFTKTQPPPKAEPVNVDLASAIAALGVGAAAGGSQQGENIWTEEFIQQATSNFEKTMRALMEQHQGKSL